MKKYLQIGGFLIGGLGLSAILMGGSAPGGLFMLIGVALFAFSLFSADISKKHARKELMELKSLLDNGIITNDEFEEKSKALKNKI